MGHIFSMFWGVTIIQREFSGQGVNFFPSARPFFEPSEAGKSLNHMKRNIPKTEHNFRNHSSTFSAILYPIKYSIKIRQTRVDPIPNNEFWPNILYTNEKETSIFRLKLEHGKQLIPTSQLPSESPKNFIPS